MQTDIVLTPFEKYKFIRDYSGKTSSLSSVVIDIQPPGTLTFSNDTIVGTAIEYLLEGAVIGQSYDLTVTADNPGGTFDTWSKTVRGEELLPSSKQETSIVKGLTRAIGLHWDTGDADLTIANLELTIKDLSTGAESLNGVSDFKIFDNTNDPFKQQIISFVIDSSQLELGTYIVKAKITSGDSNASRYEFQHTIHIKN